MNELPFNDDFMIYDLKTHRYVLTEKCVLNELGINLALRLNTSGDENPSAAISRALAEVSQKLYTWIYSHNVSLKMWTEYVLAKYEPCREIIKECLKNEVAYNLKNGDFYNYAGVNVTKGQSMDLTSLRDRIVSYMTEQTLYQTLPNGICLLYQGSYCLPLNLKYREDY